MTAQNIFGEKFGGMTKRVTGPANDGLRQVAKELSNTNIALTLRHSRNLVMIQASNLPQLTSAKPRSGMSSIAELMPRLIRQYELQAELKKRSNANPPKSLNPAAATIAVTTAPAQQTTFGWD